MLKTSLRQSSTKKEVYMRDPYGTGPMFITETYGSTNGHFKAGGLTNVGSVLVAEPLPEDSIALTDLILTTDKTTGSTVSVEVTDGTNSITLLSASINDAPVHLSIPFRGRWQTWESAGIQLTLSGGVNPKANLAIGYFHVDAAHTLSYADWNARRL